MTQNRMMVYEKLNDFMEEKRRRCGYGNVSM